MLFSYLALGMLVFLLTLGWFGSLALLVKGRRKQSRGQAWFGGVAMILVSLPGLYLLYPAPLDSAIAYKDAFGMAPSSDVTALRSATDGFADWDTVHLGFKVSPNTIQRITAKGWSSDSTGESVNWRPDGSYYHDEDTPEWWRPRKTATTRIYFATKRLGHYSTQEEETLIYDAGTQQAYYWYHGLD